MIINYCTLTVENKASCPIIPKYAVVCRNIFHNYPVFNHLFKKNFFRELFITYLLQYFLLFICNNRFKEPKKINMKLSISITNIVYFINLIN